MTCAPTGMRRTTGFTLVELAVVLAVVTLLLGSLMYTLSAQVEQRNFDETRRRLDQAYELLLSYAIVNGRLPCPATSTSSGVESIATAAPTGTGGTCSVYYNGYLPATTIGFATTDGSGFALDSWGNRIRYGVSKTSAPHFTNNDSIKASWSTTTPADIDICKHLTAANASTCAAATDRVVTSGTVVAVIWSQGKNFSTSGTPSTDEANNNDAFAAFVSRTPSPSDSPLGEFDDVVYWVPVGVLYSKLIAAGALP